MKKLIFENKITFLIYLSIIVSIFLISSYYYFLNNYKKLESATNEKYIQYLVTQIDHQFEENKTEKISYQSLVNNSSLIEFFHSVKYLDISPSIKVNAKEYKSRHFGKIYLKTIKDDFITNYLEYYDDKNNYLFTIKTTNTREVINTGKNTILIFMLIVILFLLIVFLMIRKYFNAIKNNNEILEKEVNKRTGQIQSTLIELEKANLKLYDMAHTDFLTKIRNRRNFFIHSENFFVNAIRKNKELSVIMIDIDNFKTFNDTYGHDLGDKVLIAFANCVEKCLTEKDIFGRLGGEEFAISLFDTNLYSAMEQAEFIRSEIEKITIETEYKILKVTASFGVSDIRGCKDIDQVLHKADSMLYSAKRNGKNKVRSRLSTIK